MRKAEEVSEQAGFRRFLIAILVALLIGTLIRVSFAPVKIEKIVREKIEASPIRDNLAFGSAEISLADGPVPDLAIVLNKVEWRLGGRCPETAPVRARAVRVPLRFISLFTGHVSAGNVKIDDLSVDLDDIKRDCDAKGTSNTQAADSEKHAETKEHSATAEAELFGKGEVWSREDQAQIARFVSGISLSKAEVFFENRMKSVMLEDASAKWSGESLDVSTSLRFPPATVFGENLPTFAINGTVHKDEILAQIRADLSEGVLEANAVFKPVVIKGAKELNADIGLAFKDLPLSVVTPLLSKSKIVTGPFRPKFMWLDCSAEVHGIFSRLFIDNPVLLTGCSISGQVGKVSVQEATRLPNGEWRPFEVKVEKLDVARVLETFEVAGPSGVFANFGQVDGNLKLNDSDSAGFEGKLSAGIIRFAGGEGTALQPVSIESIKATLEKDRWILGFSGFKPEGGLADLTVDAWADRKGHTADIIISLKSLKLNPRVEKVVFTGPVQDINGNSNITLDLAQSRLKKLRGSFQLRDLKGSELAATEIKLDAQLAKHPRVTNSPATTQPEIELNAKSPVVEVLKTGHLYKLLQPALLGWEGEQSADGKSLVVSRVAVKGRFHDNGFHWNGTNAGIGSVLNLSSRGSVFRDHAINAELEARFPLASRLKWNVSGNWMLPVFTAASPELGALFAKAGLPPASVTATVPGRLLGLPKTAEP